MISSLSMSSENTKMRAGLKTAEEPPDVCPSGRTLTLLDAEAGGPLLQSDVVVAVGVALLKEAGGAVLHGDEGSPQGGEL